VINPFSNEFMTQTLFVISPLYVTLFWAIVLNTDVDKNTSPRTFLGKFMIFAFIVYFSHFLYFDSLKVLYAWTDAIYQFASLMVFPMYYIYFRLLTIDEKFSLRKHARYLLPSIVLFLLYLFGIMLTPVADYQSWLFQKDIPSASFGIAWLNVIFVLMKAVFVIQVVLVLVANTILIRKYAYKAAQYYSDVHDSGTISVQLLNASMLFTALTSIVVAVLGRDYFVAHNLLLGIPSLIFSVLLFTIGWLGNRQKPVNPAYEEFPFQTEALVELPRNSRREKSILKKIMVLFEQEKIYLKSCVTIQDVANSIGTNRTYISSVINEHCQQNFCTFVNQYRLNEIEEILKSDNDITLNQLAEQTGFGSVDSMKRAVKLKTNMNFREWKEEIIKNTTNDK